MTTDPATAAERLESFLKSSANADGGWAYLPGRTSRLEPTCWALLALLDGADQPMDDEFWSAGLAVLSRWQQAGGLLVDIPGGPPNLAFNGLASVVLRRISVLRPRLSSRDYENLERRLLLGILAIKGARFISTEFQRQNNWLVGWPWVDGTFSWAEPTSWCLLALKKARLAVSEPARAGRIDEAERVLVDRCCLSGGWNSGNSNVLGKELHPYVPTTALALLALRNRRELREVTRSLEWLRRNRLHESSSMALSLALVAMRAYGEPVDDLDGALRHHLAKAGPPANLATAALAAYALSGSRHECEALSV